MIAKPSLLKLCGVLMLAMLGGCATTVQPLPFQLVDPGNQAHSGTFNPNDQSIAVTVGKRTYTGFYVLASSTAQSTSFGFGFGMATRGAYGAYGFPSERWTTINGNNGRAALQSQDGERLNCEFMFEGRRLVGECRSPQGAVYQMVARAETPAAPKPAAAQ